VSSVMLAIDISMTVIARGRSPRGLLVRAPLGFKVPDLTSTPASILICDFHCGFAKSTYDGAIGDCRSSEIIGSVEAVVRICFFREGLV
jgi:hypothetical protein